MKKVALNDHARTPSTDVPAESVNDAADMLAPMPNEITKLVGKLTIAASDDCGVDKAVVRAAAAKLCEMHGAVSAALLELRKAAPCRARALTAVEG